MKFHLEDDAKESFLSLIQARLPYLLVGLIGGIIATIIVSKFEHILAKNIALAFFLPVIVYASDAIGTQTQTVYIRNLAKFKDNFFKYLTKEFFVGITLGSFLGLLLGSFAWIWLGSKEVALTVGTAMVINGMIAPIVALVVTEVLFKKHEDPALGGGPFTTVIQDLLSLSIYLLVATLIIF